VRLRAWQALLMRRVVPCGSVRRLSNEFPALNNLALRKTCKSSLEECQASQPYRVRTAHLNEYRTLEKVRSAHETLKESPDCPEILG